MKSKQLKDFISYFKKIDKVFSTLDTLWADNEMSPSYDYVWLAKSLFWEEISVMLWQYLFHTRVDDKFSFSIDVKWDWEMLEKLWKLFTKIKPTDYWFEIIRKLWNNEIENDEIFVKYCEIMWRVSK